MVKPQPSLEPYYVKLRAEVDNGFMQDGLGWMYVGFHLDPLLGVHWNNLAPPLEFNIKTPAGLCIASSRARAPVVKEEADADPGEFLLGLEWDPRVLTATDFSRAEIVEVLTLHDEGGVGRLTKHITSSLFWIVMLVAYVPAVARAEWVLETVRPSSLYQLLAGECTAFDCFSEFHMSHSLAKSLNSISSTSYCINKLFLNTPVARQFIGNFHFNSCESPITPK